MTTAGVVAALVECRICRGEVGGSCRFHRRQDLALSKLDDQDLVRDINNVS